MSTKYPRICKARGQKSSKGIMDDVVKEQQEIKKGLRSDNCRIRENKLVFDSIYFSE